MMGYQFATAATVESFEYTAHGAFPAAGDVRIRSAVKGDAYAIARLYSISSDGVADYIWSQMTEAGEDPLTVGTRRYAREGTDFSYENCTIVDVDGEVAGMLVAFPIHVLAGVDVDAVDPVLAPYAKLEEDNSYYVCGVALFPSYRGRGLGRRLLARAERDALKLGYDKVSLIVFEENGGAKRLYERSGYREVARQPVVAHPLIHHGGDAVLMVKDLGEEGAWR